MTSKVLLYDRQAGEADVIGFDASGTMNLDWTNSGWRTSWDKIVAGNLVPGRTAGIAIGIPMDVFPGRCIELTATIVAGP